MVENEQQYHITLEQFWKFSVAGMELSALYSKKISEGATDEETSLVASEIDAVAAMTFELNQQLLEYAGKSEKFKAEGSIAGKEASVGLNPNGQEDK